MKISKEEAQKKIEKLKKYVEDKEKKETLSKKLQIKSLSCLVLYESTKSTLKEAVVEAVKSGANLSEANLSGANLYGADLSGADLSGANLFGVDLRRAEFQNAKFYGKGGTSKIKKSQLIDFMTALGFIIED